ncbi:hypothetical protein DL96DRAFT_1590835, partial [Flagelloscypha sp. PMI_526]
GQCGGIGWTGSTTCDAGSTCVYSSEFFSQCLPGGSDSGSGGSGSKSCNGQGGTCTNGGCGTKKSIFWDTGCSSGMYCCI